MGTKGRDRSGKGLGCALLFAAALAAGWVLSTIEAALGRGAVLRAAAEPDDAWVAGDTSDEGGRDSG